jgi:thiol-disulfide isomerase/thioredoxin
MRFAIAAFVLGSHLSAALIPDVRALANKADFAAAEKLLNEFAAKSGKTPEWLEAYSWLARGALNNKMYAKAEAYAAKTREMALAELKKRPMDEEPRLPIAFGASQEVHAQVLAATGARSEAVAFLQDELSKYRDTSIRTRLQKNLNLLTLEGKPAPALTATEWLSAKPQPIEAYRGKALLLFFWAHWCGDCKQQAPILAKVRQEFGPRGLEILAPTRYYGYASRGEDATPAQEKAHIAKVLAEHYAMLAGMPVAIDNETFMQYGSSTTPTLVLVDAEGVVRLYHPGKMTYEDLAARVEAVLPRRS